MERFGVSNSEARKRELEILTTLSNRTPVVEVLDDGTFVVEIPQLSWEDRALLAEEKLQALVDGLNSTEEFKELLNWNPIASSIARMAIRLYEDGTVVVR